VAKRSRNPNWRTVKSQLSRLKPEELIEIIRDLYSADQGTRLFLHSRVLGPDLELQTYRKLVVDAMFPDPLSGRPVRIPEVKRLIRHYGKATGSAAGTTDLLLSAVQAGADQAADLGYGDEQYFAALIALLEDAVAGIPSLSRREQSVALDRISEIRRTARGIGWGFDDAVREIARGCVEQQGPAAGAAG